MSIPEPEQQDLFAWAAARGVADNPVLAAHLALEEERVDRLGDRVARLEYALRRQQDAHG